MKIITLVENTVENEKCIAEHGLSIYIETEKHKLLLDTGQTDAVVKNAEVLNIDLSAVDSYPKSWSSRIPSNIVKTDLAAEMQLNIGNAAHNSPPLHIISGTVA